MYALTRRIPEHQNMDQNVWKKRIKAAAIRLEGAMLLGSMAVVQMHATEGSDIFTKAKGMMNTLYKSIAGISSVTGAGVDLAGLELYFHKSEKGAFAHAEIVLCGIRIHIILHYSNFKVITIG